MKRVTLCVLLTPLLVPAVPVSAQIFGVRPQQPTTCDDVVLEVERKFPTSCPREVDARLDRDGVLVDVRLSAVELGGCEDGAVVERFDVSLGEFPTGRYLLRISWNDLGVVGTVGIEVIPGGCEADHGFVRGDVNLDGDVNVGDAVSTLNFLFAGGSIGCLEAADVDGSSKIDLTDAVYELNYLFLGGLAPPAPFEECGRPEAALAVGCDEPLCFIDLPPLPIWMGRGDGCVQCSPCEPVSLEGVIAEIEAQGIEVLLSTEVRLNVCAACGCPTGRFFAILVPVSERPILEGLGWSVMDEPPVLPEAPAGL